MLHPPFDKIDRRPHFSPFDDFYERPPHFPPFKDVFDNSNFPHFQGFGSKKRGNDLDEFKDQIKEKPFPSFDEDIRRMPEHLHKQKGEEKKPKTPFHKIEKFLFDESIKTKPVKSREEKLELPLKDFEKYERRFKRFRNCPFRKKPHKNE